MRVHDAWTLFACAAVVVLAGFSPATANSTLADETPEQHVWEGHLVCSLSQPSAYQPHNCPSSLFPGQDDRHSPELAPDVKSVVVAMDWHVPVIALTDTMRIWLYAGDISWERHAGPPPLEFRYDPPTDGSHAEDLEFRVWAGGGGGNINFVHDTDFTVHYHVFYEEPAPKDYSALPS